MFFNLFFFLFYTSYTKANIGHQKVVFLFYPHIILLGTKHLHLLVIILPHITSPLTKICTRVSFLVSVLRDR